MFILENQININMKESTYCVLGLCAADLAEFVDFSGLLGSFMINETMNKSEEYITTFLIFIGSRLFAGKSHW